MDKIKAILKGKDIQWDKIYADIHSTRKFWGIGFKTRSKLNEAIKEIKQIKEVTNLYLLHVEQHELNRKTPVSKYPYYPSYSKSLVINF